MPLSATQTRLFSRQIALPEIGVEGQARFVSARATIFAGNVGPLVARTAEQYLLAGGAGRVDIRPSSRRDRRLRVEIDGHLEVEATVFADSMEIVSRRIRRPPEDPTDRAEAETPVDGGLPGDQAVLLGTLIAAETFWRLIEPNADERRLAFSLSCDSSRSKEFL